jgi:hypothetical protein
MINKIKNLAKFVLDEEEYNLLETYLIVNNLHYARIMIDELIEKNELFLQFSKYKDSEEIKDDILKLKQIEAEIFNLYEKEYEREQIKNTDR